MRAASAASRCATTSVSVSEESCDARRRQLVAQLGEVLDDPVVDDGDAPILAQVRMGVAVGRTAVRGPSGVADAGRGVGQRVAAEQGLEVGELAGLLAHLELAVADDGDAGGVVSAVLQTAQAGDDDLQCLLLTDVPDDSAHAS